LHKKFDLTGPAATNAVVDGTVPGAGAGKNSRSTFALSKPDIGPQSRPNERAAMMK
jgi:hypothetical protein